MEFRVDTGIPGLAFLLFVFGISTLLMPIVAVQMARERSAWFPFACGFFLLALMVDVLSITQLFDITLPHRDHLLTGLLLAAFSLCFTVLPLTLLGGPFRRVTKVGVAMIAVFLLFVIASGTVRILDSILLWISEGGLPGPVERALDLATWERPAFGLLAGIMLLVFSLVFATASVEPLNVETEEAGLTGGFTGSSAGLRTLSKIFATFACLTAALYGFSVFSDAAFGTSLSSLFQPVLRTIESLDAIAAAWDFYFEWAAFLFVGGVLLWYFVSEKQWGCLAGIVLGISVYLTWAVSAGLFEDWGGPFRGAWRELCGWFH